MADQPRGLLPVRTRRENLRINTPSARRPALAAYVADVETVWRLGAASARAGNGGHAGVGAGAEQGPLALVTGERGGTAELLPGFLQPAQLGQQVAAHRGQVDRKSVV